MSYPVRGKVNPPAVAAQTHLFFKHFLSVDLEFHLPFEPIEGTLFRLLGFFLSVHLINPRPLHEESGCEDPALGCPRGVLSHFGLLE